MLEALHDVDCDWLLFIKAWIGELPATLYLGRNDPKIEGGTLDLQCAIGLPIAQIELMRNNSGAWSRLQKEPRAKPEVHIRQQIHSDDGCLADVRVEYVFLPEVHLVGDLPYLSSPPGFGNPPWVKVDAKTTRAVELRGGNGDPAVARAQINEEIVLRNIRNPQ